MFMGIFVPVNDRGDKQPGDVSKQGKNCLFESVVSAVE